jgi:DNA-binding transcriptional LysR family regulator
VDLLRLRSFVEAKRLGSFAAAAQALGYTAPAISQHVAQLEAELGCELLVRGARGVGATAPGQVLFERAERLLAEAEISALAVREAAGQLRILRVGAFPSAAQHLVPRALARLRAAHPDLVLTLSHFEPPDGLAQLAAGDVDAVVTHRYPGVSWRAPTGVRTTTLARDPLMLMVPSDHPLSSRKRVDIAELQDQAFISGNPDDPNRIALATACASAGFIPNVAFETADYAATATLVHHGFAIALVPGLAWPASAAGLSRVDLRVEGQAFTRELVLAHRTGRLSPLVDEFHSHLTADP